jgi:hypothetical protein
MSDATALDGRLGRLRLRAARRVLRAYPSFVDGGGWPACCRMAARTVGISFGTASYSRASVDSGFAPSRPREDREPRAQAAQHRVCHPLNNAPWTARFAGRVRGGTSGSLHVYGRYQPRDE